MGRHRGSKARTEEAVLERRWRRLYAAGKLELVLGATIPPMLDADTLLFAAINALPVATCALTRAERKTLCELAVHACERDESRSVSDIEQLASVVVQHRLDDALTRSLLHRLAAAYPKARIPSV
jgi:hypothetical protein